MAVQAITFEEELKKNPELKVEDVRMLREWCEKQPHLPKITDSELALFLHSNYYRIEPTKTTIENYYTIRSHVPEFYNNRDPLGCKELRRAFQTAAYMPLEGKTSEGYSILYGRLIDFDPSHYVYNDCMKLWNMITDLWLLEKGTTKGHVFVVDVSGILLGHAGRISPMGIKKYLTFLQEALPVRLKGLHFTNSIPVMDIILNMMKPFMKKELMDLLHVHKSNDTLAKYFSIDLLPNESGGKAGSVAELHAKNIKHLEDNRDYFLEEERVKRVDESLRVGKGRTATEIFGVEGSFKKLDID